MDCKTEVDGRQVSIYLNDNGVEEHSELARSLKSTFLRVRTLFYPRQQHRDPSAYAPPSPLECLLADPAGHLHTQRRSCGIHFETQFFLELIANFQ